jgi:hypothetical protein
MRAAALLALGLAMMAGPLAAAPVTAIVTVTGTDFQPGGGSPAETVVFAISFDNGADIVNRTSGLDLLNSTLTLGSALSFTYEQASDNLFVGGLHLGADQAIFGTDDFVLTIGGISGTPTFGGFLYTLASNDSDLFLAGSGTVTKADTEVALPGPASVLLFGLGLAGLGLGLVRRTAG